MRKNNFWAIVVTTLLLLTACSPSGEQTDTNSQAPAIMPVPSGIKRSNLQLLTAAQKDKAIEVPISGRVVAKNTTTLFAEVQGKIEPSGFRFKQGVTFRKGQPLIVIDAIEFTFNLESQRSSFLNILTAMMPDMKEDYAANYKPWLAYVESYRTGEPLQALPDTRSNGEKYFVTSRGVYTSYFAIKALEERLEKYTIEAPYNGIVTQSGVDQGGLVSPGQPLGEIISTDEYELEAGVGLEVANALRPGDKLTFKSNQQPGEWIGTVVRIGGTVDSKTQNVSVFFSMSGKDLRPGTYLEGVYNTSDFEDVFVIHNSLLGRDQTVLILDQNLIVRKVVEPIEYVQDSVLIRGLQNEDQLILNQFSEPVEGQTVTLQ